MASGTTAGAVIALAGVIIGSGFKTLLDILRDEIAGARLKEARLFETEREAYARFFASVDDVRDLLDNQGLDESQIGPARLECWRRVNETLAMIDMLAPQAISDLAAAFYDVAELPYEDPVRIGGRTDHDSGQASTGREKRDLEAVPSARVCAIDAAAEWRAERRPTLRPAPRPDPHPRPRHHQNPQQALPNRPPTRQRPQLARPPTHPHHQPDQPNTPTRPYPTRTGHDQTELSPVHQRLQS